MRKVSRSSRGEELAVYSNVMQPVYERAREDVGSLSVEHVLLEQRRDELAKAQANAKLIMDFGKQLPAAGPFDERNGHCDFRTRSLDEAKNIQANTVWWRGDWPHYIVGQQFHDSSSKDLLLLPASNPDIYGLMLARVKLKATHTMQGEADRTLAVAYSEMQREEMLDKHTGELVINGNTPGSIAVRKVPGTWRTGAPPFERVSLVGDDMMDSFEINKHLYGLATAFGQEDYLDDLFAQQQGEVEEPQQLPSLVDRGRVAFGRLIDRWQD